MNEIVKRSDLLTTRIEEARANLAAARSMDYVIDYRDRAEAMRVYMQRRDAGSEAHAHAWELVQCANRRLGELIRELPKAPGARTDKEPLPISGERLKAESLREIGISTQQASRLERLANLSEDDFAARLEIGRAKITKSADPSGLTATTAAAGFDGDSWGTPEEYADSARQVLGGIELDPASNAMAQNVIRADRFYTKEQNGLTQPWTARTLWLNPPYSSPLCAQFVGRFVDEFEAGHFTAGIVLVNNATETAWCQSLLSRFAVCFPSKRIAFLVNGKPIDQNRQGQALFYAGPKLPLFKRVFRNFGQVMVNA